MKNVLVLAGDSYKAVGAIFDSRGWNVLYDYKNAPVPDLVVFTGGVDVSPELYGAERHPMTQPADVRRDRIEKWLFEHFERDQTPMVGICRGGQLLNVLNGGTMIQHLGKTVSGDVQVYIYDEDKPIDVRVDHHQGMIAKDNQFVDAWYSDYNVDCVIWYPETKSLCFQGHPEWGHKGTEDYFFELIGRYVLNGEA